MDGIMAFFIILILVEIIMYIQFKNKKIKVRQIIAATVLFVYFWIVLESTVLTRISTPHPEYELELFWSWKKAIGEQDVQSMTEIVLNVLLLFPIGLLLPAVTGKRLRWYQGLMIGVGVSLGIEVLQLVMHRGLFEFDDLVHNGVGCMMGVNVTSMIWGNKL